MNRITDTDFILKAVNVGRKASSEGAWLFRNLSLSVRSGERISVIGDTGSGKTLFLRALAFLDPIDEGQIHWLNHSVVEMNVPEFRSKVMYLPQKSSMFSGTVEENLKLPFQFFVYKDRSYDQNRVQSILEQLGRHRDFITKSTSRLSGGEMQIVSLVRALQLEPQLLMLDEPTASLDSNATQLLESVVLDWCSESPGKRSFVWISHSSKQAKRVSNRRFHLAKGLLEEVSE